MIWEFVGVFLAGAFMGVLACWSIMSCRFEKRQRYIHEQQQEHCRKSREAFLGKMQDKNQ